MLPCSEGKPELMGSLEIFPSHTFRAAADQVRPAAFETGAIRAQRARNLHAAAQRLVRASHRKLSRRMILRKMRSKLPSAHAEANSPNGRGTRKLEGGLALPTGLMATCLPTPGASQPGFPDPAWSDDQDAAGSGDRGAIPEALEQRAIQPARGAIIDIFHAGAALARFRGPQTRLKAPAVMGSAFAIKHPAEPFDHHQTMGSNSQY